MSIVELAEAALLGSAFPIALGEVQGGDVQVVPGLVPLLARLEPGLLGTSPWNLRVLPTVRDADGLKARVSERDARQTGQVLNVVIRDLDPGR